LFSPKFTLIKKNIFSSNHDYPLLNPAVKRVLAITEKNLINK